MLIWYSHLDTISVPISFSFNAFLPCPNFQSEAFTNDFANLRVIEHSSSDRVIVGL